MTKNNSAKVSGKIRRALAFAGVSSLVIGTALAATSAPAENRFAIRDVRVFDGLRNLGETTVIVEGGVVTAVARDARIPADLLTIDGRGKTLLPGLIDAHTHSWGDAQQEALRFGVTTELDMMGDWNRLPGLKRQRETMGRVTGADLWSAGAAVTATGGHGTQYGYTVPTLTAEGDAAVPLAQFAGADFSLFRGLAFSAAEPNGAFEFKLDQVELR